MYNLTVADILTAPVLTVSEDWPLSRLRTFLVDNGVTGAPVTSESGEVVGVVSMTDIVRHCSVAGDQGPREEAHEYYVSNPGRGLGDHDLRGFQVELEDEVTVAELMTPMLFEVPETATVQDVADMMVRGGIHRVLVTTEKKLVGIVSALDVLKVVRDL